MHNWSDDEYAAYYRKQRHLRTQIEVTLCALAALRRAQEQLRMGAFSGKNNNKAKSVAFAGLLTTMDQGRFIAAVIGTLQAGHVISISRTKAGDKLVLSVYDGKDNDKVYPETPDEVSDAIDALCDAYGVEYATPPLSGSDDSNDAPVTRRVRKGA